MARRARGNEPAQRIAVSIEKRHARWVGTLSLQAPGGEPARRRVSAASCRELASVLALVAALAIDPEASTARLRPPKPPAPKPAPQPKPKLKLKSAPPPRHEPRPPAVEVVPPAPRRVAAPVRWRFGAGVQTGFVGAVAPGVSPELRALATFARERRGAWAPELAISVAVAGRTSSTAPTSTTFTWITARLDACPVVWRALPDLGVRPCVGFDAGALLADSAQKSTVFQSDSTQSTLWLSGDGLLAVEWRAASFLELRGSGGVLVPLLRRPFVFDQAGGGSSQVYRAPPVGGEGELGLVFWF